MQTFKIKTWKCDGCNYRTDRQPLPNTACPSCKEYYLIYETDINQRLTINVMDESTIDAELADPERVNWTDDEKAIYRAEREVDMEKALAAARLREDNS